MTEFFTFIAQIFQRLLPARSWSFRGKSAFLWLINFCTDTVYRLDCMLCLYWYSCACARVRVNVLRYLWQPATRLVCKLCPNCCLLKIICFQFICIYCWRMLFLFLLLLFTQVLSFKILRSCAIALCLGCHIMCSSFFVLHFSNQKIFVACFQDLLVFVRSET